MKLYRYFHFLNLDIVLGALATSCLAARLLHARPGWTWWVTLGATVWLLYTGDHMMDAWRHRKKSERSMHLFIFRHRRSLLWAMGVTVVLDLFLVFHFLDRAMLKYALLLCGLVLLFYAVRHVFRKTSILFIPGEIFVLVLYLAGTWMGPMVVGTFPLQPPQFMVMILMAGILMLNLGIISLYDVQLDSRLGISTLASRLGTRLTRNLMAAIALGILLLAVLHFLVYGPDRSFQFSLILSGMALILVLVLLLPSRFRKEEAYRMVADGVLYMGFLSLLIH
jgi:1,4-dihydroxy-2-naphthoate octaprenyltransferase